MTDRKSVVVSGAFGTLGQAVVQRFARSGANIACIDLGRVPPAQVRWDQTLLIPGTDLANAEEAATAVRKVLDAFGRIDALVNVAGGFRWQTVAEADWTLWDLMLTVNLKTATHLCRAALPALIASGNGAIVNVGAGAALKAGGGMGLYAASKAGVHRLTEALADELRGKVRVNAVLPSIIDTPQNRADMPTADFPRWVRPADLAAVIDFLVSDDARAVTGALVPVNGGL